MDSEQALGDLVQGLQLGCHRHSPGDRQQGPELRGKEGLEGKGEERDAEEATQTGPTTDGIPRRSDREELRAGSDTSDLGAWRDGSAEPVKGIGSLGER